MSDKLTKTSGEIDFKCNDFDEVVKISRAVWESNAKPNSVEHLVERLKALYPAIKVLHDELESLEVTSVTRTITESQNSLWKIHINIAKSNSYVYSGRLTYYTF